MCCCACYTLDRATDRVERDQGACVRWWVVSREQTDYMCVVFGRASGRGSVYTGTGATPDSDDRHSNMYRTHTNLFLAKKTSKLEVEVTMLRVK